MGTISKFTAGGNPVMECRPIQERVEILLVMLPKDELHLMDHLA